MYKKTQHLKKERRESSPALLQRLGRGSLAILGKVLASDDSRGFLTKR